MTHRGPFQTLPFCDSVILFWAASGPNIEQLSTMTSGTVLAVVLGPM